MAQIGNEIFGRPLLLDMQRDAQSPNANSAYVVTERLLRASPLLQYMSWVVSPGLAFPYKRARVARVGQTRAVNTDYAPKFAGGETQQVSNLAILGDAYEWDRVLGAVNPAEVQVQIDAMAPAIGNRFCDLLVNGDRSVQASEFDGLSAIAEGIGGAAVQQGLNLTMDASASTVQLAFRQNLNRVTAAVRQMRALGLRPMILGNVAVSSALDLAGNVLGAASQTADAFGASVIITVAGAPLIDSGMANVYGTPTTDSLGRTVYPVEQQEIIPSVVEDNGRTVTDLYVVGVGINGLTGVTLGGFDARSPVRFETARTDAGAVRRAEIEMVAGIAALDERAVIKFSNVVVG